MNLNFILNGCEHPSDICLMLKKMHRKSSSNLLDVLWKNDCPHVVKVWVIVRFILLFIFCKNFRRVIIFHHDIELKKSLKASTHCYFDSIGQQCVLCGLQGAICDVWPMQDVHLISLCCWVQIIYLFVWHTVYNRVPIRFDIEFVTARVGKTDCPSFSTSQRLYYWWVRNAWFGGVSDVSTI